MNDNNFGNHYTPDVTSPLQNNNNNVSTNSSDADDVKQNENKKKQQQKPSPNKPINPTNPYSSSNPNYQNHNISGVQPTHSQHSTFSTSNSSSYPPSTLSLPSLTNYPSSNYSGGQAHLAGQSTFATTNNLSHSVSCLALPSLSHSASSAPGNYGQHKPNNKDFIDILEMYNAPVSTSDNKKNKNKKYGYDEFPYKDEKNLKKKMILLRQDRQCIKSKCDELVEYGYHDRGLNNSLLKQQILGHNIHNVMRFLDGKQKYDKYMKDKYNNNNNNNDNQ